MQSVLILPLLQQTGWLHANLSGSQNQIQPCGDIYECFNNK